MKGYQVMANDHVACCPVVLKQEQHSNNSIYQNNAVKYHPLTFCSPPSPHNFHCKKGLTVFFFCLSVSIAFFLSRTD
jgi:hypothetical protein